MPGLERGQIEMKIFGRGRALAMIPTIGQQHSANIEKNHVEGEHRRLSV
jgi:hypothetical protein